MLIMTNKGNTCAKEKQKTLLLMKNYENIIVFAGYQLCIIEKIKTIKNKKQNKTINILNQKIKNHVDHYLLHIEDYVFLHNA